MVQEEREQERETDVTKPYATAFLIRKDSTHLLISNDTLSH